MSTVLVICPHCGKELKLRDRSKLGQKGKCPGCAKAFVLNEAEEEVPLQLASDEPPVGTGARWVPDEPVRSAARQPAETAAAPLPQLQFGSPAAPAPSFTPGAGSVTGAASDGLQRLKEIRRRNAKRRNLAILFGGLTALAIGGTVWGLSSMWKPAAAPGEAPPPVAGTVAAAPNTSVAAMSGAHTPPAAAGAQIAPGVLMPSVSAGATPDAVTLPHQALTPSQFKENERLVSAIDPRRGEPIRLFLVPSGVNAVIHLRPARLWSDEPHWQELRYSLTEDVTNWIAATLKQHCRREPQQIDECLICLRLGAIGTEPEIAVVVNFAQDEKLSDLIEEFRGQPLNEEGVPRINIAAPYAYFIRSTKTVAIAPERDAAELAEFVSVPNSNPTEGIYRLLDLTDRERVFTVLFEVDDVKRHEGWLFSERTLPIFRQLLNWFGDDVETVSWSVDLNGQSASSELILRNRAVANAGRLARDTLQRLEYLPRDLQSACRRMHPATKGFQAIIGRFPAMIEAYRQATIPTVETRHVRLTTVLPRKAAPNLALGTLLAWDQSTHTDFSTPAPPTVAAASPASNLPDKVEDRLKLQMDGEFNSPFQDAIAFIAQETKVEFDIDGNALKDAGFTKNMPQKFSLGRVSGLEALKQIALRNNPPTPDKRICIVIDEAAKKVLVTTESFAKEAGQTIYPLVTP